MAEREVIREFLTSLGFTIDESGFRKFNQALISQCKVAGKVSATIAGVAVAAEAMTQRFAYVMERLYYSSKKAQASAANVRSLSFAASHVGIAGEEAVGSLQAMAKALRLNPGQRAVLDNLLGRGTEGGDNAELMIELVKRLHEMPHWLGAQFAEMFGIPEEQLLLLRDAIPQYEKARQRALEMYRAFGVDQDQAAAAGVAYTNTLRDLWEQVKVLGDGLAITMLPYFQRFASWISDNLPNAFKWLETTLPRVIEWLQENIPLLFDSFMKFIGDFGDKNNAFLNFFSELINKGGQLKTILLSVRDILMNTGETLKTLLIFLYPKLKAVLELFEGVGFLALDRFVKNLIIALALIKNATDKVVEMKRLLNDEVPGGKEGAGRSSGGKINGAGMSPDSPVGKAAAYTKQQLINMADAAAASAGVPAALYRALVQKESNWNVNALSPKGAFGLSQLMPDTAKDLKVDPKDVQQNLTGGARYLAQMKERFGNYRDALAAYNIGPNAKSLKPNYGYADSILGASGVNDNQRGAGLSLNNTTTINVQGGEAGTTARAVADVQSTVFSLSLRDFLSATR